jgi:hypothetical protein
MKRAYATAGYLLALTLLATVTAAQTRPDFSGVWKPVESPGSASPPLPLPQPDGPPPPPPPPPPPKTVSTTIVQSATELIIDRRVEIEGRETVYTFVYNLDGTESVNQRGRWCSGRRPPGTVRHSFSPQSFTPTTGNSES